MDPREREANRNWAGGVVTVIVIFACLFLAFALIRSI